MRFFIALDLPALSEKEIHAVQEKVKSLIPQARLTESEQLHLTIAFIGEQLENIKEKLIEVMAESAKDIPPFSVTPSFIDGFPHLHQAQILWVGVKGDIDKLYVLRHRIKDGLKSLNLGVDERRYIPHIAVAKLKDFKINKTQEDEFQKLMFEDFTPLTVSSIKLYESIPEHGLHHHNTLAEIKLFNL